MTESLLVSDAVSSQQPNETNAIENNEDKQQSSSIINQEATVAVVNEQCAQPTSDSKSEEATENSKCKTGDLILEIFI